MELRQLRYFVKIAELGSISRAARALFVAQPALSQQIAQLEAELGQPLLLRRHNGVRLTDQGAAFCERARHILKTVEEVPEVVNRSARGVAGSVSLGLPRSTCARLAHPLLAALRKQHPGIELQLSDELSGNLLPGLQAGRLDLAVLASDREAAQAEGVPLVEEELFLIVPAADPLRRPVPHADLPGLPLALPAAQQGWRAVVDEALEAHGLALRPAVVANSVGVLANAVASGQAYSVLPHGAVADDVARGVLRAVSLDPPLWRRSHACHARGHTLGPAAHAVLELAVTLTHERVRSGEWAFARLPRAPARLGTQREEIQ